jgi:hypothetical protein
VQKKSTFRYFTNEATQGNSLPPQALILCKFYPFCTSGSCAYLHPQEVCANFPECPFGKKCHFLHPPEMCKYGSLCNKENCVRIHPPKPRTPCKRGFACNKEGCTFFHPQEKCRFGNSCQNPSCHFSHATDCRYGTKCYIPGCRFAHSLQVGSGQEPDVASPHHPESGDGLSLVVEPEKEESDENV